MADAGGAGENPMRIFVGGLGVGVTAEDMEKTFSTLGRVAAVDLVRTNGRSFAYMNFHPNSDKSLARLFATYNGCMWKGAKLRVEKAKEHYLARLSREWAEDAKPRSSTPADLSVEKNLNTSNKPGILNQDMQLNIYFPKLRKVKSLPFKGTGKHKYSFQRIEVPPLPIHFCDCEEHSVLSETASQKYFFSNNPQIHEKELSIMTAVMNKLFEKDEKALDKHTTLDTKASKSTPLDDEYMSEESEVNLSDTDNLLTNIGLQQQSDDALDRILLEEVDGLPENQELKSSKLHPFIGGNTKSDIKSHKKQKTITTSVPVDMLDQKSHAFFKGKVTEDERVTISPRKRTSEKCMKEVETCADALPVQNQTDPSKSMGPSKGHSWLQKSSWKDLVGEVGNSSFTISRVIPGINFAAQKSPISNGPELTTSAVQKKRKVQFNGEGSTYMEFQQKPLAKQAAPTRLKKTENDKKVQEVPGEAAHGEPGKNSILETRRIVPKINIGEVCTFMRNAESEKEWTKAKTILSGYLKKKGNVNDAKRNSKGTPRPKV
ncbi:hypothetical protein J5N97_003572 [Dioscorea zingiberensis]|uniref:RRM domain-containing protein n=1 Tax=Dioscorea zingiberensis TaxID=325984 RepID=A0A9D5HQM9_9LILI|nr:hypothetical protein J5N97_003572 [Dioscorea zingiberensis]